MDKDKIKNFGYKLGYIFGEVCIICVMAIVVALTARLIAWIF